MRGRSMKNHNHCNRCKNPIHPSKKLCSPCNPKDLTKVEWRTTGLVDPETSKTLKEKYIKTCYKCGSQWEIEKGVMGNMIFNIKKLKDGNLQ